MSTGTILTLRGHCDTKYTTFTLDSLDVYKQFNHDPSDVTVVTQLDQLTYPSSASGPSAFDYTKGSPNVSLEFVVEVQYPSGTGPNMTQSIETYRVQARNAVNTAFQLSLA